MENFTKEIDGAIYTVDYTVSRQHNTTSVLFVKINKIAYKKLEGFNTANLLSRWQLKKIIENQLYMPLV